jgi:hypothetical protein
MSNVLNAFIKQTYGSLENANKQSLNTDKREELLKKLEEERFTKALEIISRDQSIANYINIPTKLNPDQLNQKTIPHTEINYDHSLTMDRKALLRENYLNKKYKDNPQEKPSIVPFSEDWGDLDQDGDLPIL